MNTEIKNTEILDTKNLTDTTKPTDSPKKKKKNRSWRRKRRYVRRVPGVPRLSGAQRRKIAIARIQASGVEALSRRKSAAARKSGTRYPVLTKRKTIESYTADPLDAISRPPEYQVEPHMISGTDAYLRGNADFYNPAERSKSPSPNYRSDLNRSVSPSYRDPDPHDVNYDLSPRRDRSYSLHYRHEMTLSYGIGDPADSRENRDSRRNETSYHSAGDSRSRSPFRRRRRSRDSGRDSHSREYRNSLRYDSSRDRSPHAQRSPNYRDNDRSSYGHSYRGSDPHETSLDRAASFDRSLLRERSRSPKYRRDDDRSSYLRAEIDTRLDDESSRYLRHYADPSDCNYSGNPNTSARIEEHNDVEISLPPRIFPESKESNPQLRGVDPQGYRRSSDKLTKTGSVPSVIIKVLVVPNTYPKRVFTETQAEDIELSLAVLIKPGKEGSGPQFNGIYFERGTLVVICKNLRTKAWLEEIVPKLSTKGVSSLRTITPPEVLNILVKVMMFVSHPVANKTPKSLLKLLKTQNVGLEIENWYIVSVKKMPEGVNITMYIDQASAAALEKYNMNPCLGLRKVRFAIIKKGT